MIWLKENFGNIITILLIAGLLYACVRSLIREKRSGLPACGRNCAGCTLCCSKRKNARNA